MQSITIRVGDDTTVIDADASWVPHPQLKGWHHAGTHSAHAFYRIRQGAWALVVLVHNGDLNRKVGPVLGDVSVTLDLGGGEPLTLHAEDVRPGYNGLFDGAGLVFRFGAEPTYDPVPGVFDWVVADLDLESVWPSEVRERLTEVKPPKPVPKVSAQGNPVGMVAGVWPYLLRVLKSGEDRDALMADLIKYVDWECYRSKHYYTDPTEMWVGGAMPGRIRTNGLDTRTALQQKRVAVDYEGHEMLNDKGEPMPYEASDGTQHGHNLAWLIWSMSNDPAAFVAGAAQIHACNSQRVSKEQGYAAMNAREIGWEIWRALEGVVSGIAPQQCRYALKIILDRNTNGAKTGDVNDEGVPEIDWRTKRGWVANQRDPWFVLTDTKPETIEQGEAGDHGFCRVDVGKTAIVYLALRRWIPFIEQNKLLLDAARDAMSHCAAILEWAAKRAEGGLVMSRKYLTPPPSHQPALAEPVPGLWQFPEDPGAYWASYDPAPVQAGLLTVHWISYDEGDPASPFAQTLFGGATNLAAAYALNEVPGYRRRMAEHVEVYQTKADALRVGDPNFVDDGLEFAASYAGLGYPWRI